MTEKPTVLVTGAAGGIGGEILAEITHSGSARVVGWDLVGNGTTIDTVDIADPASLRSAVHRLIATHGRVHGLVHCAAIVSYQSILEAAEDDWRRVLEVNLASTIALCQQLLPHVADHGRIVLFGSGTIFKGPPELFSYVAAKAGLRGLVRSLARDVGARGITVNMISPGFTNTPIVAAYADTEAANIATRAIPRRAEPVDIVGPVMFFLSEASRFVTGQNLAVDGGSVMT